MKTSIYTATIAIASMLLSNSGSTQNANTSLSNLVSPTKVNVSILPNANALDLGSGGKSWRNIYAGNAYFLNGTKFISSKGTANIFIGNDAGKSNTNGEYNTVTGFQALFSNISGSDNTATGFQSMYYNTSGYINTAYGDYTLYHNTNGAYNSAQGFTALYNNTSGISNTATGYASLYANSTGSYNTATGIYALQHSNSDENSAYGVNALASNTSGMQNIGMGNGSLYYNTTGSFNTGMGYTALFNTMASQYNTAVGYKAGDSYNNGWNNVFIGANTDVNGHNYYNVIAIGQGTICTDVNQARIGNPATVSIGGYSNWTNLSDKRVKKNIHENVPGLAFINKLKPITYNLDLDAANKIIQPDAAKDKNGKILQPSQQELDAIKTKEQILYSGFAAQDVEQAAKELDYDFSGIDAAKNSKDLYGLRYSDFVVPLVKAVQELSKQNEAMKDEIEKLKSAINQKSDVTLSIAGSVANVANGASLEQNTPNPFNNVTSITYTLPQSRPAASTAQIVISDIQGKIIRQINITGAARGTIEIDSSFLSKGVYNYSLIIDGKRIITKQMVVAK